MLGLNFALRLCLWTGLGIWSGLGFGFGFDPDPTLGLTVNLVINLITFSAFIYPMILQWLY